MIDPKKITGAGMRPAAIMMICSALAFSAASSYVPPELNKPVETTVPEAEELPEELPAPETEKAEEAAAQPEEAEYVPEPWLLNLAFQYPENSSESYASVLLKELIQKDSAWYASIYDLADVSPAKLASRIGRDPSSVLGAYNPLSDVHVESDPSTWAVEQFKNVSITFYDGSGHVTSAVSNAQDILSMASVYSYYNCMDDIGQIRSYMNGLWDASHSYLVSMSDVYYCDGCVDPDEEKISKSDESSELSGEDSASLTILSGSPEPDTHAGQETLTPDVRSDSDADRESGQASSAEESSKEVNTEEETAGTETESPAEEEKNLPETASAETESMPAGPGETVPQLPETEAAEQESSAADSSSKEDLSAGGQPESGKKICPGHVDLSITANIISLSGVPGLIGLDSSGNGSEGSTWSGWTGENQAAVRQILSENWAEAYHVEITAPETRTPLSSAEIDSYISQLPEGTDSERIELIRFALQSVGKIPYYWGGKASCAQYGGNGFGTITAPDHKGRILRGLDCSGWISWVYWSVTGKQLASASTDGLSHEGRSIGRQELKPGDVAVITGETPHAVMFMNWTEDGRMLCIHESGSNDNVTVSTMTADWPYYRNLLDETGQESP